MTDPATQVVDGYCTLCLKAVCETCRQCANAGCQNTCTCHPSAKAPTTYKLGWRYNLQKGLCQSADEVVGQIVTEVRFDGMEGWVAVHVADRVLVLNRGRNRYDGDDNLRVLTTPPTDYGDAVAMGLIDKATYDAMQQKEVEEQVDEARRQRRQEYEKLKREFEP